MKRLLFISLIIAAVLLSCRKECHVKETDGIEKCKKKETCVENAEFVFLGQYNLKEFVVNDDSTFFHLLGYNTPSSIDFTKQTLLGTTIGHGGCGAGKYSYKVIKDSENKEYTMQVRVRENGYCSMYISITHGVAIPKIEDDYTVRFTEIIATCKDK